MHVLNKRVNNKRYKVSFGWPNRYRDYIFNHESSTGGAAAELPQLLHSHAAASVIR